MLDPSTWYVAEQDVLRWAHIIAMAYWLGGEWGVFNASRPVADASLSLDERLRHMETAYRIDIFPRTGIILLLPLGLHMGFNMGVQPLGGPWITGMWIFTAVWIGLAWTAFFKRGTDLGLTLTKIDEAIRWVIIPLLLFFGLWTLFADGPIGADWYAAKMSLYAVTLIIGLFLRFIMRDWVMAFRKMAAEGSTPAVEKSLADKLAAGRAIAYVYWILIATTAFLGATKPFA